MNFACKVGFHRWQACRCARCGKQQDTGHDWQGYKCATCGKTRGTDHTWQGCKCVTCGETRDTDHRWQGCKCPACGAVRDAEHDWQGCKCTTCGKVAHEWASCKCTRCGAIRHTHHAWQVEPNSCEGCGAELPAVSLKEYASAVCSGCGKPVCHWGQGSAAKCRGCGLEPPPPTLEALQAARSEEERVPLIASASFVLLRSGRQMHSGSAMSGESSRHYEQLMAALGRLKQPSCIPALAHVMLDGPPNLKVGAAQALGAIGHRDAVPYLLEAVEQYDAGGWYKAAVFEALVAIADRRAADAIAGVLPRLGRSLTRDAALALGRLRDRRAVPLLKALIHDEQVIGDAALARELLRGLR